MKNKWYIFTKNKEHLNICVNAFARKLGECWNAKTLSIKSNRYRSVNINRIYNEISIPFKLTFNKNYGHAFWDDLYSVYTSLVKIGFGNKLFNLIIYDEYRMNSYLKDIYRVLECFSKGKNVYINEIINRTILFRKLVVGSSHQCQRCITSDYTLKYSREYNMTKVIRDRMYEVYNITPTYKHPLKGVIVHNKRFNNFEIKILKKLVNYYNSSKDVQLSYINFENIKGFYNQLKLLSNVHLYISGPGTGLLNFPFISDPGVVIHLGHVHFGCPQYLEQYILEGSPHFKALYYSPNLRMKNISFSYLIKLINEGINYIKNNKSIYVRKNDNLNSIGKLFVRICSEHKDTCNRLIETYDWGYGKCRGIWAENVVFFPSVYKHLPHLKDIVIMYNNSYSIGCKVGINYSKQKQWC